MRQTLGSSEPTSMRAVWLPWRLPERESMADREPVAFITAFSRALRERGLPATPASSIDAVQALAAVDVTDKSDVYFALRSVLATRRQDFAVFDQLFENWWGSHSHDAGGRERTTQSERPAGKPPIVAPWSTPRVSTASTYLNRWAASAPETPDDETVPLAAPSTRDSTGSKDFRNYDDEDVS